METRVFADEQAAAEAAVCSGLSCSLDSRTTRHDHRPVLDRPEWKHPPSAAAQAFRLFLRLSLARELFVHG